ncbi:MAG: glycosyltransferase family 2 protein [Butyrivibrio sp.]|jgi:glycosyltransferase involved in cell wall biosynthesis|nr:glycosyltransferase family 2 protein [Butyrivibrio sp.]
MIGKIGVKEFSMITIFTPVYNRRMLLERVYRSLCSQTSYAFEWIIVDDGSTDQVDDEVYEWIKKTQKFTIKYFYIKHGGKHRAINYAVKKATAEAFMILDSDDYLLPDAVKFVNQWFSDISAERMIVGVSGLKVYPNGKIIGGDPLFEQYIEVTNLERDRYGLAGDKAEVYKTSTLRKYPFPEYPNEIFLSEGIVWDKIAADGAKLRWYNVPVMVCEYRPDGLSRNTYRIQRENPQGWAAYLTQKAELKKKSEERTDSLFVFFEYFYDKYSEKEMMDMLHITRVEYEHLGMRVGNIKEQLKTILADRENSKGAIYGVGINGNRLFEYLRKLNFDISFAIDKDNKAQFTDQTYKLTDIIPLVDIVFITPKNSEFEIEEAIRQKKFAKKIIRCDSIAGFL